MITKITPLEELKQMFVETMLNKTSKVTKISETSVLNGIAYGVAKVGQKILKDVSIVESHLFPDTAFDVYLDEIAKLRGVSPRQGAASSSMYIRVFATPGTQYIAGFNTFTGNHGVVFDLDQTVTVDNFGFAYVKVKSQMQGLKANVDPLTTIKVAPIPTGHQYCINEYAAIGGQDFEADDLFRERIKREINVLARETMSYMEHVLNKINPNVLRCFNYGFNDAGQVIIAIATVNGAALTNTELNGLLVKGEKYFSLTELRPYGVNNSGIQFTNITWQPVDISFRCDLDTSYNIDETRKRIQVALNKEFDYRFWTWDKKIEWDNLLQIVKKTQGVKYVSDNHFFPNVDYTIMRHCLPRVRGFQMLDLDGTLIANFAGTLNPTYYPAKVDFQYQADVLASI